MQKPNSSPPEWFHWAISRPFEDRRVSVRGATIRYRVWGERNSPGLVLAHGGGGHLHWWDFIAPYFMGTHCVIALDFAGMGDSDHRERYDAESFAAELVAVCDDIHLDGPDGTPAVVGKVNVPGRSHRGIHHNDSAKTLRPEGRGLEADRAAKIV